MPSKNKKSKFPTAQTVLLIITGLVALLTWFVPAGEYDRLSYDKEAQTFTRTHLKEKETLDTTQKTLDDGVGVGREFIVNAYQYGMGLFAFLNPTVLILASLAIVKVGYDKWLKFATPLVLILLTLTMAVLTISVYL